MTEPAPSNPSGDSPPPPGAPAGWYPDPDMVQTQRYWDGQQWTDHAAPAAPLTPAQQAAAHGRPDPEAVTKANLYSWGIAGALLLPIVGLAIGIVMITKGDQRGGWIIGGSMVSIIVWAVIFWPNPTTTYG